MLRSRLPQIIAELPGASDEALKDAAEQLAEAVRERVPVASGALRDAVHVQEVEHGYAVVAGDSDAFYGHMVEFGTTHTAARPFLIPAFEAQKDEILGAVEDALEDL